MEKLAEPAEFFVLFGDDVIVGSLLGLKLFLLLLNKLVLRVYVLGLLGSHLFQLINKSALLANLSLDNTLALD